jgi:hypothetical protein
LRSIVRRLVGGVDPGRAAAQHFHQLVMHDLDDLLGGVQPLEHVSAERLLLHRRDELAHDLQADVRFEQRDADLAQGNLQVVLGDFSPAPQLVEDGC